MNDVIEIEKQPTWTGYIVTLGIMESFKAPIKHYATITSRISKLYDVYPDRKYTTKRDGDTFTITRLKDRE